MLKKGEELESGAIIKGGKMIEGFRVGKMGG